MNKKYYIKNQGQYGFCIKFKNIKPTAFQTKFSMFEISDLYFVDYYGIFVSPNKKSWNWINRKDITDCFNYMSIPSMNNVYEFETDEEALLCFEVMKNE